MSGASGGGKVHPDSGTDITYYWNTGTWAANQSCECKLSNLTGGGYLGPAVRMNGSGDGWAVICADGTAYLNRYSGGAWSGEAYSMSSPGGASTPLVKLTAVDIGGGTTRLTVYFDGVSALTHDTTTIAASGYPGLIGYGGTGGGVTADDWYATDL